MLQIYRSHLIYYFVSELETYATVNNHFQSIKWQKILKRFIIKKLYCLIGNRSLKCFPGPIHILCHASHVEYNLIEIILIAIV